MSRFLGLLLVAAIISQPAYAQLSERTKRILGTTNAVEKDSLVAICQPSVSSGTAQTLLFKQVKKSDADLNGSKLVNFVSYDGKRRAVFEVRTVYGAIGSLNVDKAAPDKFLQRWNEASESGDAAFTVNASGFLKFRFTPPKSTSERVLFFRHSTPELAELQTGFTKSNTYSCSIAVFSDDKLLVNPVTTTESEDCIVNTLDPDCIEIEAQSRD